MRKKSNRLMNKKSLNSSYVFIFIFILSLVFLLLFMHGSSQKSRMHYMIQCYYVPEFLPKFMWRKNLIHKPDYNRLIPPSNYTGIWKDWHWDGYLEIKTNYSKGLRNGECLGFHSNGDVHFKFNFLDGVLHGIQESSFQDEKILGSFVKGKPNPVWRVYRKGIFAQEFNCYFDDTDSFTSFHIWSAMKFYDFYTIKDLIRLNYENRHKPKLKK